MAGTQIDAEIPADRTRMVRCPMTSGLPSTLAQLRAAVDAGRVPRRSVKDEIRENLIARLRARQPVFPGIIGYEDTVVPQIVNAILSRHNFILLGLRGQAKSRHPARAHRPARRRDPGRARAARSTTTRWRRSARRAARACGRPATTCRSRWLARDERYVEKLATPDVTIADMIGDLDPIKAARAGLQLSDELTMHYGLLPRANRGIFAINELPDLAGKIQVGLFNILQEGDVQIKGYPVRLPLDVLMVFSANPEDYTARGKIITPLKDRIGSEIRTHYPATRHHAMAITAQEAWVDAPTATGATSRSPSRSSSARSSRKSRSRRGRTRRSTSARASASGCRSRCSRTSSRTPSGARCSPGEPLDRAARHRHLRRAAGDHRQVRARVRRRAARRRQRRARHHPRRRRQRVRRLLRRCATCGR